MSCKWLEVLHPACNVRLLQVLPAGHNAGILAPAGWRPPAGLEDPAVCMEGEVDGWIA